MIRIRSLFGLQLFLGAALACHDATAPSKPSLAVPLRDRIVFESNRADSLGDIFAMKLDGSDVVALTDQTTADLCPALSPDGQHIAYYQKTVKDSTARFEIRSFSLVVMSANGTQKRIISEMSFAGWGRCPFWSSDATHIGVLDWLEVGRPHTPTYYRFRVFQADGTLLQSFTASEEVGSITFTPAGDRFLVGLSAYSFGPYDFRVSLLSFGGAESRLAPEGFAADWSQTAGKIAYGCSGICLMNPDGTSQVKIIASNASLPLFSPDGSLIAYSCNSAGFCFTTLDGKTTGPFSQAPLVGLAFPTGRTWAPDSRSLAFTCGNGPEDICLIDRDGSNLRNLTQSPTFYDRNPSFSPLGAH